VKASQAGKPNLADRLTGLQTDYDPLGWAEYLKNAEKLKSHPLGGEPRGSIVIDTETGMGKFIPNTTERAHDVV
jgi:hypothetical protein